MAGLTFTGRTEFAKTYKASRMMTPLPAKLGKMMPCLTSLA